MATESGGDEAGNETGGPGGPGAENGDKTARRLVTNETAATGGVMYAEEDPYTINVCHLCLASVAKFCDGGL